METKAFSGQIDSLLVGGKFITLTPNVIDGRKCMVRAIWLTTIHDRRRVVAQKAVASIDEELHLPTYSASRSIFSDADVHLTLMESGS